MNPIPAPANDDVPGAEEDDAKQATPSSSNRWFILGILVLGRMSVAFQFQSVAAVGPLLVRELSIDYAMLRLIIGLYMLPGLIIALPAGLFG